MSLARETLRYEWRRFLPGLLSVAFAGVLMLVQLGLLLGMFGTVTVLVDESSADLWVSTPEMASFDQARDIPEAVESIAASSPGVVRTEVLRAHDADWRSGPAVRVSVTLVGLDPNGDALGCPRSMRASLCASLAEPMAVIVDEGEIEKLGSALGHIAELNGKRVRVVGVTRGLRSIGSPYVFASRQTARALADPTTEGPTFVLAEIGKEEDPETARERMQAILHRPSYRVWTARELSIESQRYWLLESGVGAGFLFSSLLGLIIGVAITSQTLRGVILASIREFATFRAIGVPPIRLGGVVIEESLWIGVLGAVLTLVASLLAGLLARAFYVPLLLTWWSIALAIVVGLVTAVVSGLLALRELYRLEPAELLR